MKIRNAGHLFTASVKGRVAKKTKLENFLFFSLARIVGKKKRKASEERPTPERRPKRAIFPSLIWVGRRRLNF